MEQHLQQRGSINDHSLVGEGGGGGAHDRGHYVERAVLEVVDWVEGFKEEVLEGRGGHEFGFYVVGNDEGENIEEGALGEDAGVDLGSCFGFVEECLLGF